MKKIYFLSAIIGILYTACNKVPIVSPDDFTVSATKTSYKVNENVVFNISGNPDNVLFYSGEPGKDYSKASQFTATGGTPEMQFLSNVQFGAAVNNLSVLVSNDFNGLYDTTNVRNAHWTDVTSRLVLGNSATNVSSGVVSLNDLKVEGKPMFVAFKYLSILPAVNKQKQWTISSFQFRTKYPDGRVYNNAATNADASFGLINFKGDSARWVSSTTLSHTGLPVGYPGDEDWAITKTLLLDKISPDAGTVIKAISQPAPPSFSWVYTTPGTYKVVFVAQNSDVKNVKKVVREVDIIITQ